MVPKALQSRVLYLAHYTLTAGHPEGSKMYDTLRTQFYWLNMTMKVFQTARDCRDCAQSHGTRYRHQKKMTLFRASPLLDYISIDLLGPLIKSENGYTAW